MGLLTYYCSCEPLWLSIFKYLVYFLVLFLGILIGKKYQKAKFKSEYGEKILLTKDEVKTINKFYHNPSCNCDICFNQRKVLSK
jgi:hypothetical protein